MTHPIIQEMEKAQSKKQIADFSIGDTVEIRYKIREGDRERIQPFIGTAIGRQGTGMRESVVVRRLVQGEGVERIFPLHSPHLVEIRIRQRGEVRRAKLFYLRKRIGKATRIKGRMVHEKEGSAAAQSAPKPEAPPQE